MAYVHVWRAKSGAEALADFARGHACEAD
jgi:hypothetical protein